MRIMNHVTLIGLLTAFLFVCLSGGCQTTQTAHDHSALDDALRGISLEEAQAQADAEDRVLLVVGTADWCGPCRRMKADTWTDPKIGAWVDRHATLMYLDIDDQREVSRALEIRSIPQIVAFRNGVEVDRIVGYRDADSFLGWLNGIPADAVALGR